MKRFSLILLIFLLAVASVGCNQEQVEYKSPVTFYYCRAEQTFGQPDSVLLGVPYEAAGYEEDYVHLLNAYLQGTGNEKVHSPFPAGTHLVSFKVSGWSAQVRLSSEFADLTGLELTIACSCITKTIAEMTGVQTVTIRAQDAQLDGSAYIIMDVRNILLEDTSTDPFE